MKLEIEVSTASWEQDENGNMALEITKLEIYPSSECERLNLRLEFQWFQICTRPINLHMRYRKYNYCLSYFTSKNY